MPDSLQLYSVSTPIKKWITFSSGIYIVIVLNLFEPFAIELHGFNLIYHLILSTYGVITGATTWFLLSYLFPITWRKSGQKLLGLQIYWWIALVLIISISNWAYSLLLHYTLNGWRNMYVPVRSFFELVPQFLVMYSVWGILSWGNVTLFQRQKIPEITDSSKHFLSLFSENQSDRFRVGAQSIICFHTCDNYLQLYYLNETGSLTRRLIRSSMKKMIEQLAAQGVELFRCHQSYLVNPDFIKGVDKNGQQLTIEVAYLDFPVLVSRKNIKATLTFLEPSTEST